MLAQFAWAQKTFVYCSEGNPSTFNPQLATDGTTFNAASHPIFNKLLEFKTGTTELEPSLAESWTISKDQKKYTFKLRKNVSFHTTSYFKPTRNFNADDVIFSFEIQKKPQDPLTIKNGNYEYFKSMGMDKAIKSIKKIDDHTVEFTLNQPEAPFLANLAMDFAIIHSKEYVQKLASEHHIEQMNIKPIGTGPFIFKSFQKDSLIRYTANPDYFAGKPKIDNLVFSITPDSSVRYQKLKTGECHLIIDPAPSDLSSIAKNSQLKLLEKEGLNVGYVAMNVEKKPLDNVKVRQAIYHAMNRKNYIDSIYLGRATLAKNPIPPTIWSFNEKVKDLDYNIAKAKQLLKEAGYPNGFNIELWALPVSRPYNPAGKKMAELMQQDLAQVGIKVTIKTYDWSTYLDKSRKGEHQLIQLGWTGDNGDPDNFLNMLLSCGSIEAGSNTARWCNKKFNSFIEKAKIISNHKQRVGFYQKAQEVFNQQVPWVPIAYGKVYRAMSNKVHGYVIHPFGGDLFDKVDIQ
ncbi:MAG: ABC transporter substrate-binding protein [Bdellovibrionales bacterium]|nr:ABC transporter substrate-binding protein [Bdellovibrionales bacterium]